MKLKVLLPLLSFCLLLGETVWAQNIEVLKHDKLARRYAIFRPSSNDKVPLVLALHGGGGSALAMTRHSDGTLEKLAKEDQFLLVYPEGVKGQWNDLREYPRSFAHRTRIDDIGFLTSLIEHLVEKEKADPKRVYVMGVSNGGMMAQYLAIKQSDKIAAACSIASSIPKNLYDQHLPTEPVAMMLINGTADPIVPWKGGMVSYKGSKNGRVLSVEQTIEFWVDINECSKTAIHEKLKKNDSSDPTRIERLIYRAQGDKEVILYKVVGGGHHWPGNDTRKSRTLAAFVDRRIGPLSRELDASLITWEFFKRHSKQ